MRRTATLLALAAAAAATPALAYDAYLTPNVVNTPGPVATTVGNLTFVNKGLQGVGRIAADTLDPLGETFGSVSALQITGWDALPGGSYAGTFNILPDRGVNDPAAGLFTDYANRVQEVPFSFTPYTAAANIGGTDVPTRIAAQSQISFGAQPSITTRRFQYAVPGAAPSNTTGLDPGAGTTTLFGQTVPFVLTGPNAAGAQVPVNKLALDAEGLHLNADGSGYVSDEYGPNVYHFDANKVIDGVLGVPEALRPHTPAGTLNFNSTAAPANGRRNNQGMEGIAVTPDGTALWALMQSATVQDTDGGKQQTRLNARLLKYDLTGGAVPSEPVEQYVVQLPVFDLNGDGSGADRTAAQSELLALDDGRLLVLPRDGNGLGVTNAPPTVFKSVALIDTTNATDIDGLYDAEGATITETQVNDPVLNTTKRLRASITPATLTQVVNVLDTDDLSRFNINLSDASPDLLTLSEKLEGLALVPAFDPANPDDYFLFVANDNDFLTADGVRRLADGSLVPYDASFSGGLENDTFFLAYRVTVSVPEPAMLALLAPSTLSLRRRR